jgi:hypothetical protein
MQVRKLTKITNMFYNWHSDCQSNATDEKLELCSLQVGNSHNCAKLHQVWSTYDFCHQGQDREIAQKIKIVETYADMTIHWKALEEHFLMVPLVLQFNHFQGTIHFLKFSPKKEF